MTNIDYFTLKENLKRGLYHNVIELGLQVFDRLEIYFLVIDAYLELNEVNKAETLLNTLANVELTSDEKSSRCYYIAKCQYLNNDYTTSLENLEKGLDVVQQTGNNPLLEARLLTLKGEVYWRQGKLDLAQNILNTAIALLKEKNDSYYLAIAFNALGMILRAQRHITESIHMHEQALRLRKELGNSQHIANSFNNIAVAYWTKGALKTALDYLEQALALKDKIENTKNIANWITNIATIKATQGFLYAALQMHSEALVLFEKSNNIPAIATMYCNIGEIYRNLGQTFEAKSKHEYALKLRINIGNPHYIAESIFYVTLVIFDMRIPINIVEIQNFFPKPSVDQSTIQAYYSMIQGLLAQQLEFLNDALHYWQNALNTGLLEFYFQNFCYEQITLVLFKQWMNNPTFQTKNKFKEKLKNWEHLSKENNLVSSMCKIYLINAKLELIESHYETAEILLNLCNQSAQENDLEAYMKLADREMSTLKTMKDYYATHNNSSSKTLEKVQFEEIPLYIKNINKILDILQGKQVPF